MTLQELESASKSSNWEILNNGVTDVIVVYFNSAKDADLEVDDSFVGRIDSSLRTTSYVALFTGNLGQSPILSNLPETHEKMAHFERRFTQPGSDNTEWPEDVIAALFISAFLLFIAYLGICCTFNIQSSLKFDGDKLQQNVAQGNQ